MAAQNSAEWLAIYGSTNPDYVAPISQSLPNQTQPAYCTDEDILARAGGDFVTLVPPWQNLGSGVNGAFAPNTPWIISSASVDFQAQGIKPNSVVHLTAPKTQYPGGGDLLVADSVAGNTVTLRRPYLDLWVGQPPAPAAGLTGVNFLVPTLIPQINNASFDIKRRFGIDERIWARNSEWIYSLHDVRDVTVLTVLWTRYLQENRGGQTGDFWQKVRAVKHQLDDALGRVQVRWGPFGNSAEPSTLFSCKLSR